MGGTWGSFSPVRWICWRPFGGIGFKAAARTSEDPTQPNRGAGLGQPGNCVIRAHTFFDSTLSPSFFLRRILHRGSNEPANGSL